MKRHYTRRKAQGVHSRPPLHAPHRTAANSKQAEKHLYHIWRGPADGTMQQTHPQNIISNLFNNRLRFLYNTHAPAVIVTTMLRKMYGRCTFTTTVKVSDCTLTHSTAASAAHAPRGKDLRHKMNCAANHSMSDCMPQQHLHRLPH